MTARPNRRLQLEEYGPCAHNPRTITGQAAAALNAKSTASTTIGDENGWPRPYASWAIHALNVQVKALAAKPRRKARCSAPDRRAATISSRRSAVSAPKSKRFY